MPKRENRIPNPFKIKRPSGEEIYLNPEGWNLTESRKLLDWATRLVAHKDMIKNRK